MTGLYKQGVWIEQGNPDIAITDSVFENFAINASYGIRGENYLVALTIARNTFDVPNYAIYLPTSYSASAVTIEENTIFSRATHVLSGASSIYISHYGYGQTTPTIIRNNTLIAEGSRLAGAIDMSKVNVSTFSVIEGNTISGYTNTSSNSGYGISGVSGGEGLVIRDNLITVGTSVSRSPMA